MFGMFLCNNSRERAERNIANRTFSVWNILQAPQFVNHLYYPQEQKYFLTSVSVFLKSTEMVDEGLDATTTFTNTVQHHVMLHCRILEVSSYLGERISKIYGDR
ncbi:hypothetical protein J6590_062629 [Homalodisca vitripennis]|nr:hypothetical protein J6590_062629 [Homalodisca vitripennis]